VTSVFRLKSCLDCNGKSNFCISFVPLIFSFVLSLDLSSVLRIRSCWCYEIYCPSFLPPPGFGPRHFCVLFLTASPPVRSGASEARQPVRVSEHHRPVRVSPRFLVSVTNFSVNHSKSVAAAHHSKSVAAAYHYKSVAIAEHSKSVTTANHSNYTASVDNSYSVATTTSCADNS
jgi:hypothetical protein